MSDHPLAPYAHLFEPHPSGMGGWLARIPAGHYRLSVIAGRAFYCEPREDRPGPLDYERYEVGILGGKGLIRPPADLQVPCLNGDGTLLDMFEPGDSPVAGYVPAENIAAMIPLLETPLHKLAKAAAVLIPLQEKNND